MVSISSCDMQLALHVIMILRMNGQPAFGRSRRTPSLPMKRFLLAFCPIVRANTNSFIRHLLFLFLSRRAIFSLPYCESDRERSGNRIRIRRSNFTLEFREEKEKEEKKKKESLRIFPLVLHVGRQGELFTSS